MQNLTTALLQLVETALFAASGGGHAGDTTMHALDANERGIQRVYAEYKIWTKIHNLTNGPPDDLMTEIVDRTDAVTWKACWARSNGVTYWEVKQLTGGNVHEAGWTNGETWTHIGSDTFSAVVGSKPINAAVCPERFFLELDGSSLAGLLLTTPEVDVFNDPRWDVPHLRYEVPLSHSYPPKRYMITVNVGPPAYPRRIYTFYDDFLIDDYELRSVREIPGQGVIPERYRLVSFDSTAMGHYVLPEQIFEWECHLVEANTSAAVLDLLCKIEVPEGTMIYNNVSQQFLMAGKTRESAIQARLNLLRPGLEKHLLAQGGSVAIGKASNESPDSRVTNGWIWQHLVDTEKLQTSTRVVVKEHAADCGPVALHLMLGSCQHNDTPPSIEEIAKKCSMSPLGTLTDCLKSVSASYGVELQEVVFPGGELPPATIGGSLVAIRRSPSSSSSHYHCEVVQSISANGVNGWVVVDPPDRYELVSPSGRLWGIHQSR